MAPKGWPRQRGAPYFAKMKAGLRFAALSGSWQRHARFAARNQERRCTPTQIFAVTAGAFLLAGFIKGVIGLGLPTVASACLG